MNLRPCHFLFLSDLLLCLSFLFVLLSSLCSKFFYFNFNVVITFVFWILNKMIGNLVIFPVISLIDIVSINELTLVLKIIGQCDVEHIMTLLIKTTAFFWRTPQHYHSSSNLPHCAYDTSDNVCLNLQNCRYSKQGSHYFEIRGRSDFSFRC